MEFLPKENSAYKTKDYWNQRYEKEEKFDWFKTFADVQADLEPFIPKESRIVMMGCGNSTLSADMYDQGWKNIVNVDFSEVVIQNMAQQNRDRVGMQWRIGDILNTPSWNPQGDDFEIVIDKGTMDALMTEKGDVWSPPEQMCREISTYIDNVYNVLSPGGRFIYITFGQPHFRKRHLECAYGVETGAIGEGYRSRSWKVETVTLRGTGFDYFMYICTKFIANFSHEKRDI